MNQEVFAAQILDAMTKANAGGMRPSFESQVPAQAGDFADTVAESQVRRGEIRIMAYKLLGVVGISW